MRKVAQGNQTAVSNASRPGTSSPSLSCDLPSLPRPRREGARTSATTKGRDLGPRSAHTCCQETRAARESRVHQLGCRNSVARAVAPARLPKQPSPARSHLRHDRGRFACAVHQHRAGTRRSCGRPEQTRKRPRSKHRPSLHRSVTRREHAHHFTRPTFQVTHHPTLRAEKEGGGLGVPS